MARLANGLPQSKMIVLTAIAYIAVSNHKIFLKLNVGEYPPTCKHTIYSTGAYYSVTDDVFNFVVKNLGLLLTHTNKQCVCCTTQMHFELASHY